MTVIYVFETRYYCRLDPVTQRTVLNPYTPISFE